MDISCKRDYPFYFGNIQLHSIHRCCWSSECQVRSLKRTSTITDGNNNISDDDNDESNISIINIMIISSTIEQRILGHNVI